MAIRDAFGDSASHGVIVKTYSVTNLAKDAVTRNSPAQVVAVSRHAADVDGEGAIYGAESRPAIGHSGFWSSARACRYQEADRHREDRARHGAGEHLDDRDLWLPLPVTMVTAASC